MHSKNWKDFRRRLLIRVLPPVATLLIRLLSFTLRYRIHVSEDMRRIMEAGKPVIFAFWHGRMLIMPPLYRKVCGKEGKDAWIMVSHHTDGELIARTVKPFRILSARGSSTRGGRHALEELVEKGQGGHTIGITPDGPRGPLYCVQPGVVRIAQRTGIPIVPLTWAARPRWVAWSWDRFQVPLPFARTAVVFDEPIPVPDSEDAKEVEAWCARVQARLREVTDRMEAEVREVSGGAEAPSLLRRARGAARRLEGKIRAGLQALWDASSPRSAKGLALDCLFLLPSFLYGRIVLLRRALYRKGILRKSLADVPVVSIGGVRVGGSGKTPFVMWMARRLAERGCRVVVLTRGYGRRKKGETILLTRQSLGQWDPLDCGDEPYLLAEGLPDVPVAVDGDRFRAAKLAQKAFSPDFFLMDDGFQHLGLARAIDVVLLPGDEDLSRMACLPRGPLREPLSALRDADFVVCVSSAAGTEGQREEGQGPWCKGLKIDAPVLRASMVPAGLHRLEDRSRVDPRELEGRRIAAFCGIARPAGFRRTLERMGLTIEFRKDFPDHHRYSEQDYQYLTHLLNVADVAVTTEKDAVKIGRRQWPAGRVLFLRLDVFLEDEKAFWSWLEGRMPACRGKGVQGEKVL